MIRGSLYRRLRSGLGSALLQPSMRSSQHSGMSVRPIFAWYDFWVGLFWDQNKRVLYVFPIPMFGFKISFRKGQRSFGPGEHGFSHCENHKGMVGTR